MATVALGEAGMRQYCTLRVHLNNYQGLLKHGTF